MFMQNAEELQAAGITHKTQIQHTNKQSGIGKYLSWYRYLGPAEWFQFYLGCTVIISNYLSLYRPILRSSRAVSVLFVLHSLVLLIF